MIAPLAGIAVVSRPLLGQPVGLADGGVEIDGERRVAGSRSGGPGPGQQFPAHPVQLVDVAPPESAQEGAQGGWRLDPATENTGAQRSGVVDAVAASQRGGHQRHQLVAGVGPARRAAKIEVMVYEFHKAQV